MAIGRVKKKFQMKRRMRRTKALQRMRWMKTVRLKANHMEGTGVERCSSCMRCKRRRRKKLREIDGSSEPVCVCKMHDDSLPAGLRGRASRQNRRLGSTPPEKLDSNRRTSRRSLAALWPLTVLLVLV